MRDGPAFTACGNRLVLGTRGPYLSSRRSPENLQPLALRAGSFLRATSTPSRPFSAPRIPMAAMGGFAPAICPWPARCGSGLFRGSCTAKRTHACALDCTRSFRAVIAFTKGFTVLGNPVCLTAVQNPAGGFRVTFDVPVADPIRGQCSTDYSARRSFLSRYRPRCPVFTQPCLLQEPVGDLLDGLSPAPFCLRE